MYNIDQEFIDCLRDDGYDLWTIGLWENWLTRVPDLVEAGKIVRENFQDVRLGDGIGLLEANGLDNYAAESELEKLRQQDERNSWQRIDVLLLNRYHSAPSFFDARGFVFHLPAFLLAELNDQHEYGFIDRIIQKRPKTGSWIDLLTPRQASALIAVLSIVQHHPDYIDQQKKFEHAINRFAKIVEDAQNTG